MPGRSMMALILKHVRIPITIGRHTATYVLYVTNAPRGYDGFGTLTLAEDIPADGDRFTGRLVAIREEHALWQAQRYGSGLYAYWAVPPDAEHDYLEEIALGRMLDAFDSLRSDV